MTEPLIRSYRAFIRTKSGNKPDLDYDAIEFEIKATDDMPEGATHEVFPLAVLKGVPDAVFFPGECGCLLELCDDVEVSFGFDGCGHAFKRWRSEDVEPGPMVIPHRGRRV